MAGSLTIDGAVDESPLPPAQARSTAAVPTFTTPVSTAAIAPEPGRVPKVVQPPRRRRWVRRSVLTLVAIVVIAGGWFGYRAVVAANKILGHGGKASSLLGGLDLTSLKGEGDGRVNILIMGVGGAGHEAPNLSDTMMVASLDPKTKDVAMLSVPRDLYVKIPGKNFGKINSANALGGPDLAEQTIENVIGVPIHYYVVVDFSGFKQAVDAVGGVDINVKQAIYDPMYPCDDGSRKPYCPLRLAAGPQHMNGAVALKFARSRKTTSDFDRAARQQQVIVALRQQALKISTLTNPVKLTALIESVGDHVKTDLQLGELKKLADIAKDVTPSKISTKVLDTGQTDSLLIDGSGMIPGAGSIELPKAGNFNYSDIQDFVKNIFTDHYLVDENARVEVQNGSGVPGLAGKVVTSLKSAHYNVGDPTNATSNVAKTMIYDYTSGKKPYTINYLERRFGVKAQRTAAPSPSTATSSSTTGTSSAAPTAAAPEIRIILGSDYQAGGGSSGQ